MKGNKRWRSGAWRLAVFAGIDPDTGKQRYVNETVHTPNNRAGAKACRVVLRVECRPRLVADRLAVDAMHAQAFRFDPAPGLVPDPFVEILYPGN